MKVRRLMASARLPERSLASAGYDLFAAHEEEIDGGSTRRVYTGLAIEIPEDCVGIIKSRSSLAGRGVNVVGGVIDPDYRGDIIVLLQNTTDRHKEIRAGDKIAQLLVVPCYTGDVEEVKKLSDTERGTGGFGSTGY